MHLARFPRVHLGHFPTPLEFMPNLTRHLDGPNLYIKRDDCTGLATGGNKTRKLEFLVADAIQKKADVLITQGAVQSNHARQTAAAAAKFGLECQLLFEERIDTDSVAYNHSGNVFLDELLGAKIVQRLPAGSDMNQAMQAVADELRAKGKNPYVIPGGGSNAVGALGYVSCAMELLQQSYDQELRIDHVVHATGSAGTQAGLVVGFGASNSLVPVYGVGVRAPKEVQEQNVWNLCLATLDYLGLPASTLQREQVVANTDYVGEGYGLATKESLDAIRLLAEKEAILLDPVYSAKGMAGLIDLIKKGHFKAGENIVFLHTGGMAGLYGYPELF